jgi:hypothetical protein
VASIVNINCSLTESTPVFREDDNSLTLRGRLISTQLEISSTLKFRVTASQHGWMDSIIIGRPADEIHKAAIPHYKIILSRHEPMSPGCHGSVVVENLDFWPDSQLVLERSGPNGEVVSAARSAQHKFFTEPGVVEDWCLFFYKALAGELGALVLRKSSSRVGAYERLGLLEVQPSHSGLRILLELRREM